MNQNDIDVPHTIILLVGLPGSGKSTWVKNFLLTNKDFTVLSTDDIIQAWADAVGKTYTDVFHDYMSTAEGLYKSNMRKALAEGKNIIVDRTNLTKKARRKILSNVPKTYKKIAIVFNTPIEEVKRRLLQREYDTGKSIPDSVFDAFSNVYEKPSADEGFDEIKDA